MFNEIEGDHDAMGQAIIAIAMPAIDCKKINGQNGDDSVPGS